MTDAENYGQHFYYKYRDYNSMNFLWCRKMDAVIPVSTLKSGLESNKKYATYSVDIGPIAFFFDKNKTKRFHPDVYEAIVQEDKNQKTDNCAAIAKKTLPSTFMENFETTAAKRADNEKFCLEGKYRQKVIELAEPTKDYQFKIVFLNHGEYETNSAETLKKNTFLSRNTNPNLPIAAICPFDKIEFEIKNIFKDAAFQTIPGFQIDSVNTSNPAIGRQFDSFYCNYERGSLVMRLAENPMNVVIAKGTTQTGSMKKSAKIGPNRVVV